MNWNEQHTKKYKPDQVQIEKYIKSLYWGDLLAYLESSYQVKPIVEHSRCTFAPGWNVKYRKGGRALCTLYPHVGYFTCLVSVGSKHAMEADLILLGCTDYVRELYTQAKPFNGARWLMIDVTSKEISEDVKKLITLRVKPNP